MNAPLPIASLRARGLIEPEARDPIFADEPDIQPSVAEVGASIAISLRRIADVLDDVVRNGAPINVGHRP